MDTEERRNNSNKVLLTVIGAATFITAMVGATFAYFSATHTTTEQTITTATTRLNVSASNVTINNIRPTKWTTEDAAKADNEVVKTTVNVTGSTTSTGTYNLHLDHSEIVIGSAENQGVVGDFKYAVYDDEGNQIVAPTSFTAAAVAGTNGYLLAPTSHSTYTEAYSYTGNTTSGTAAATQINDTYQVYVWIENSGSQQNNLQDMNFNISFTVDGQSTH